MVFTICLLAGAGLAGTAITSAVTWITARYFIKRKLQALDVTYLPANDKDGGKVVSPILEKLNDEDADDLGTWSQTQGNVDQSNGRKLGRVIGGILRVQLGYPAFTPANRTLAAQRALAVIQDNYKDLRKTHRAAVVAHAVYWTFTPIPEEKEVMDLLCTREAYERERAIRTPRLIPRYRRVPVAIQEFFGTMINPLPDFH